MAKNRKSDITELILKQAELGKKPKDIATELGISVSRVYNAKNNHKRELEKCEVPETNELIKKHDELLIRNLKDINIRVSNALLNKSFKNESSPQLMKTLAIAIDKLRILEGKSTENVAHRVLHELDDDTRSVLQSMAEEIKHAFLKS